MIELPDTDLRRALPDSDAELDTFAHRSAIDALEPTHSHSIRFRESPWDGSCLTYALRLDVQDDYRKVALAFEPPVFAGRDFADWLIDHVEAYEAPRMSALVFYYAGSCWKHAGLVDDIEGLRIVSKWGEMAVFEHHLAEIPLGYGDTARFFARPSPEAALALFLVYARGVTSEAEIAAVLR